MPNNLNAAARCTTVRRRIAAALLAPLFALVGCADDFAPPSLVETVRVLAARAEPPWLSVDPAHETSLKAKIAGSDLDAKMCHAWGLCLFAVADQGRLRCADPALALDLGTTATATVRGTDVTALLESAGAFAAANAGARPASNTGGLQPAAIDISVQFGVAEARAFGGECPDSMTAWLARGCPDPERCVIGRKTLRVAFAPADRHANPTLDALDAQRDGHMINLAPRWTADSREPIAGTDPLAPDREGLLISWFTTAGHFERERSYDADPENTLDVAATESPTVWAVVRDGRGGVDWLEIQP